MEQTDISFQKLKFYINECFSRYFDRFHSLNVIGRNLLTDYLKHRQILKNHGDMCGGYVICDFVDFRVYMRIP